MATFKWAAAIAVGLVALVSVAGSFHREEAGKDRVLSAPSLAAELSYSERADKREAGPVHAPVGAYRRSADVSVEVEDTIATYERLEERLAELKGQIVEMDIRGSDVGRSGRILMEIPTERFNAFVAECRKMGKVMLERISAQRLGAGRAGAGGEPDPREIALVALSLRDQKVAPQVEEGRGVLAASFSKGAAHFLKGMAVVVEVAGYALPFLLAFVVFAVPAVLGVRIARRRRAAGASHSPATV